MKCGEEEEEANQGSDKRRT